MTALASRFTISGDVRCFAGEALTVELAFDTAGTLVDLTGREFAWTVYRANDREPMFAAAGEVVSVGDDHCVRFTIDGDTTDSLFARNRTGLRHEMAEIAQAGREIWVEGQFSIERSAAVVSPVPIGAIAGSSARYVFDYQTRRVTISPRGAPGLTEWQAAGKTLEQLQAERDDRAAQAGAQAGAPAGSAAGRDAGAAAGVLAGTVAGRDAGRISGAQAGSTAGAAAAAPAIADATDAAADARGAVDYLTGIIGDRLPMLADILIPRGATALLADSDNLIMLGDML